MHLRHVTACSTIATYTTHRQHQRQGGLAWRIFVCPRHRRLPDWSAAGNLRRLGAGDPEAMCGTVHDHRPHGEIIVSHLHGWMGAGGWVTTTAPDDWLGHLREAHEFLTYLRDEKPLILIKEALRLAEAGETRGIVCLLADAETAAAARRSV
ncbi:hypothetical protein [Streptomyces sp. NPDC055036]